MMETGSFQLESVHTAQKESRDIKLVFSCGLPKWEEADNFINHTDTYKTHC